MSAEQIFTTIFVAFIGLLGGLLGASLLFKNNERKIETDRKNFEDTMTANAKKLKSDLLAQSSKTYKELITAERIKWLNELRKSIAEYLGKSYYLLSLRSGNSQEECELLFDKPISQELSQLCFLIILHLNPEQKDHKQLKESLEDLNSWLLDMLGGRIGERILEDYEEAINNFAIICQDVLKSEWNQVKTEAKELYKLDLGDV